MTGVPWPCGSAVALAVSAMWIGVDSLDDGDGVVLSGDPLNREWTGRFHRHQRPDYIIRKIRERLLYSRRVCELLTGEVPGTIQDFHYKNIVPAGEHPSGDGASRICGEREDCIW